MDDYFTQEKNIRDSALVSATGKGSLAMWMTRPFIRIIQILEFKHSFYPYPMSVWYLGSLNKYRVATEEG